MTTAVRQYTDEIHAALGYWATWLPGQRRSLGDCGTVTGRVFDRKAALKDFGIEFDVSNDASPSSIEYTSGEGVERTFQVAAGNQIEVFEERRHRRIVAVALAELDRQAFGQIARPDTGRLEALNQAEHVGDEIRASGKPLGDGGKVGP